ncbi:MAG TPA: M28 family peptidase [Terriglobia bacterium]
MLNPEQRWKVIGSFLLVTPLIVLFTARGLREPLTLPILPVQPTFDAGSAIEYTRMLAESHPNRVTGTPAGAQAADDLTAQFQKLGYGVSRDVFTFWLAGKRVQGQNVIAELPGEVPEAVVVIAHYDSQYTSHQAAEDNASGVGVLLELAHALRSRPHHRGLIFVATDAEEWGMIGARALRGFLQTRHPLAAISIDYLTQGRATGVALDCEGQRAGYTPLWLRELLQQSGAAQGVPVTGPSAFRQWVEQALEVSSQDQGPLLRAGIPAINLSTIPSDYAAARARYHSVQDVFENFEPATFQMVGATVEQAVSSLDRLDLPVPHEMKYLRLASGRWLDRTTLEWAQALGLLPFMLACVLAVLNFEEDHLPHPLWSYLRPALYLLPPLAGLLTLRALTSGGILTRYELYPATPKDPFLYRIPARVAVPLVAALLLGYLTVRLLRLFLPPPAGSFPAGKRILCVGVYLAVVWGLYLDPYAMWLLIGPLAYAFLLLLRPSSVARRFLNAGLLLLGALPFVALLYLFGEQIFLGWRILWYVILQAAYGVWSPSAAVLFLLVVTLWVQLFRLGVLGLPEGVRQPAGGSGAATS